MIELRHIDVYYGDLQALWSVSLIIRDGEIVTLIGSNGSGKSTTLRTISGLLRPRKGGIFHDSLRLDELPAHKIVEMGISMVPEGRRLFPEMSVLENLEVGAFTGKARKLRRETLERLYEIFPLLKARSNQIAGSLSGGEQQMLTIGRALMSRPEVLLIDEMSLGLAPLIVQDLTRIMRRLNKSEGITIFLVEQNVRAALALASRGYIIENGRIVEEANAEKLLNSDSVKNAYLGLGQVG